MYYHDHTILYYDGHFLRASEAAGDLYSQSLHYGYAAFEGIRAYDTHNGVRIFKALEHYDRLAFSCKAAGIPYAYSNEELIRVSYELLERNGLRNAYLRPLVTCTPNMSLTRGRDSKMLIAVWEWGAYLGEQLLRVQTSSFTRPNPKAFKVEAKISGHYVNSILACQEAKDAGFDEALLLDIDGYVAEGPGANLFVEQNGMLYTPQQGNILPGITRATIIELCAALGIEVIETRIRPEEVRGADSAFFCGTAAEVVGLASLDEVPFRKAWQDTLGAQVQKAYKELVLENNFQSALHVA